MTFVINGEKIIFDVNSPINNSQGGHLIKLGNKNKKFIISLKIY